MKVRIPFLYQARLLKARHQIEKTFLLIGREWFDLPEISRVDTPIAAKLEWKLQHLPIQTYPILIETLYPISAKGIMKPLELQLNKILPYSPGVPIHANVLQSYLEEWAKESKLDLGYSSETIGWKEIGNYDKNRQTPFLSTAKEFTGPAEEEKNLLHTAKWISSDRDAIVAALSSAIEQSAIMDGIVYAPSLGPVYQIKCFNQKGGNVIEIFAHRERLKTLGLRNPYSPAKEHKIAARIEKFKQEVGRDVEIRADHGLTIYHPDAFNADIKAIKVLAACSSLVVDLTEVIGKFSTTALHIYGELRDICNYHRFDIDFSVQEQEHLLDLAFNLDEHRLVFLGRQKTVYDPLAEFRKKRTEEISNDIVQISDSDLLDLESQSAMKN